MKTNNKEKVHGFTLIEVIVTLLIGTIAGTMVYSSLGTSMTKSSLSIGRLQTSLSLHRVMENIVADFYKVHGGDLPGLKNAIGSEAQTLTNSYGSYTVVYNRYIKFISNQEQAGIASDNLLKVTLRDSSNVTLTSIFFQ
ncbi:MAG: type II secretion system protein [Desulfobacterales bacterium]|nr:type II secretion system protein [Desulfobacterales bacterium]